MALEYRTHDAETQHSLPSRKNPKKRNKFFLALILAALAAGLFFGGRALIRRVSALVDEVMADDPSRTTEAESTADEPSGAETEPDETAQSAETAPVPVSSAESTEKLVRADIEQIPQLYIGPLIVDADWAFGSEKGAYYNRNCLTLEEFRRILEEMYSRGYVLVKLHDMAAGDEAGNFVRGKILLPEGKKPFVLSIEDLSYDDSSIGPGFARKLRLDEDGKLAAEYETRSGLVVWGTFDAVPLLEEFIAEHPDFSYNGARGVIALTGHEGIFGYKTAKKYENSSEYDYKEECRAASAVAEKLRSLGWELASHSYAHINMSKASAADILSDTARFQAEVDPLLGEPADILVYAYGADVGNWRSYSRSSEKYAALYDAGYRYFCQVENSSVPWVQFDGTEGIIRQGRIGLHGSAITDKPENYTAFFSPDAVLDEKRPLPIPKNS